MVELPESTLGSLLVLATDELERVKREVKRQEAARQSMINQINGLVDESTKLAEARDEARMEVEKSRITLLHIAEEIGADGIGDILDRLEELRWKREKQEQEVTELRQRVERAEFLNAHYHTRWSDVARVAAAWRDYRADADAYKIPNFEELAAALDLLIAAEGGQG